jgi:hypothetical protein
MGLNVNGKEIRPKQILEAVFDFFITLIAVSIAAGIFIEDGATLSESIPGLAITAAIGLVVWKICASYKLVDK